MAGPRKYANLPDLDVAPDIYETPELADDVSTVQDTTAQSPSLSSRNEDNDADSGEASGVVRSKVTANNARDHFASSKIDARSVDFSTRAAGAQKYYKATSRRRPRRHRRSSHDGESSSDSEEEEDLDRRMARLRQEIEEVKAAVEQQRVSVSRTPETSAGDTDANNSAEMLSVQQLSEALDAIYTTNRQERGGPSLDLLQQLSKPHPTHDSKQTTQKPNTPAAPTLTATQISQALAKTADFDARLTELEATLGLSGDSMDDTTPILHHLDKLDRQVQLISNAPDAIDAAQQKTTQLNKDLEQLQKLRAAQGTDVSGSTTNGATSTAQETYLAHPDQLARINALYGALPVIDALSPVLPLVLERLRTLQTLHGGAAVAAQNLDDIERRQSEQDAELVKWREALVKVEESLKEGEGALSQNVKTVESWVMDLEKRIGEIA